MAEKESKKSEEVKKEEVEQPTWIIGEVATETEQVAINTKTNETRNQLQISINILNYLEELKDFLISK